VTTPIRGAACSKVQSFMGFLSLPGRASPRPWSSFSLTSLVVVHVLGRRVEGGVGREAHDDAPLAPRALLDERAHGLGHRLAAITPAIASSGRRRARLGLELRRQ
jgi:hypothetical protein